MVRLQRLIVTTVAVYVMTIANVPIGVEGHGRLMNPPARASLWRFPEFANLTEPCFDDMQLWCGGMESQYTLSKGKCGPCGDAYVDPRPRENENGGMFGRGIITKTYMPGQIIDIAVDLTVNHRGYFTFNLCPLADPLSLEEEECFETHPLPLADGSGYKLHVLTDYVGFYNTTVKLPKEVKCRQCVIRWHYRTGNRWNFADDNTGALGVGDQETFRGCSDVTIGNFKPVATRPTLAPAVTPPVTTEVSTPVTTPVPTPTTSSQRPPSSHRPVPLPAAPTHRPPPPQKPAPSAEGNGNSHPHPIMRPPGKSNYNSMPIIIATLGGSTKHNSVTYY